MNRTKDGAGVSSAAAVVLILILVVAGLFVLYGLVPDLRPRSTTNLQSHSTTSSAVTTTTTPSNSSSSPTLSTSSSTTTERSSSLQSTLQNASIKDPSIRNGTATITFQPLYQVLANYELGLINQDRAKSNLSPVTLSPVESGQQHADSMLYFGYFSHWDTQGYKPYIRYTLLGGKAGVLENVAFEEYGAPTYFNATAIERALSDLEFQMMNNDSACCNNGHRNNILQPQHNRVSIGIAYNETRVYLVQDFENSYINLAQPIITLNNGVRLSGSISQPLGEIQVVVFYDSLPQPLSKSQLDSPPYIGSYDQGTFIGGVVPACSVSSLSCFSYPGHVTVVAQRWQVNQSSLDIEFTLSKFIQNSGKGVYTVYIIKNAQANPVIFFDISVPEGG